MKLCLYFSSAVTVVVTATVCVANDTLWLKGGHSSSVGAIAWSPDGTTIVSASDDTTVKLWSASGSLLKTLSTQPYQATAVTFSPDSTILAVGTYDGGYQNTSNGLGRVLIWQASNGWAASNINLLRSVTNRYGKITSIAISPDGTKLASANASGSNYVYQISNGALLAHRAAYNTLTGPAQSRSLAFSPGGFLVSGSDDGTLRAWNSSWTQVWNTNGTHASNLTAVAVSLDGSLMASASMDQSIRLWSTANWTVLRALTGHTGGISSAAFSPDGSMLASACVDGTVKLWRVSDGVCLVTIDAHADEASCVAFSPDGVHLASSGQDNCVKIWSVVDGSPVTCLGDHSDYIKAVAISPDGLLCASAGNDRSIQIRNAVDGALIRVVSGNTGCVSAIAFAPDNTSLASAGGPLDPTIKLWGLADGELLRTINANSNGVTALAFSADGRFIASGGDFDEQVIKLWDATDGSLVRTLPGHSNGVTALSFSPKGDLLASGGRRFDNTVKVWSLADGSLVRSYSGHSGNIEAVAFSGDGGTVASGSSGPDNLKTWLVSDGTTKSFGVDSNAVFFVGFTPNGEILASAGRDSIRLWDVTAGNLSEVLTQETFRVSCAAYSPNGNLLAFGRQDATLALTANVLGGVGQPSLTFTRLGLDADGSRVLEAAALPMTRYLIQMSTNLSDWRTLAFATAESSSLQVTDQSTNAGPQRFYRAITPP